MRRCRTFVQITPGTFRAFVRSPAALNARFEILDPLCFLQLPTLSRRVKPVSVGNFGKLLEEKPVRASRDRAQKSRKSVLFLWKVLFGVIKVK